MLLESSERGLEGGLVQIEVEGGQSSSGAIPDLHRVVNNEAVAAEGLDRGSRRFGADLSGVVDQPGYRRCVIGKGLVIQQGRDLAQFQSQLGDSYLRLGQGESDPLEGRDGSAEGDPVDGIGRRVVDGTLSRADLGGCGDQPDPVD